MTDPYPGVPLLEQLLSDRRDNHPVPAEMYFHYIEQWQRFNGGLGKLPMKRQDPKLMDFVCYARKAAREGKTPQARYYAQQLNLLGLTFEKTGPRGVGDRCQQIAQFLDEHGRLPSLRAEDVAERRQGVWLMRIVAGILPTNFLEADDDGPRNEAVDALIDRVLDVAPMNWFVAEWLLLCLRSRQVLSTALRNTSWGDRLDFLAPATLHDRYRGLAARLASIDRNTAKARETPVPDPRAEIEHINACIAGWRESRPFRPDRMQTESFVNLLVVYGWRLGPSKSWL